MSGKKRVLLLIQLMLVTYALSIGMAVVLLYRAEIKRERMQLVATAQSQARLIEAVARFDSAYNTDFPGGPLEATLSQIIDAHDNFAGFGRTGEFTLARQVGEEIVFQFSHRNEGIDSPSPVPLDSDLAEPMRRALNGKSGTLIGLDYRGETVLAAYEPVDLAGMGIVAKIDLAEVRAPFIRVASVASGVAVILVLLCWFSFLRISDPMLKDLKNHAQLLQEEIDQRKIAEIELGRSEAKYRAVAEDTPVMICRFRPDGEIVYANGAYCESIGRTAGELIGTSFLLSISEGEREAVADSIESLNRHTPIETLEHRVVMGGEAVVWHRWTNRALFDAEGEIVAYQSVCEDITERKSAELERDRLFAAVNQLEETVFITDPEGTILYANPAMERNTGYSLDELIGRNPRILKSGRYNAEFYASMWKTITSGENWSSRVIGKRKDGAEYEVDATITPVFAGGEIVNYVSVQRDVTREAQLQAEVRQAQKMEAVGLLAGGIAHDFNNMLSVIIGHSDVALEEPQGSGNEAILKSFRAIRDAALRSATLTRQLLAFSRKQIIQPVVCDLHESVLDILKMLRRLLGEDIAIDTMTEPNLWHINFDPGHLDQILVNLTVNARDAMPSGGRLIIRTENMTTAAFGNGADANLAQGEYVKLTIRDFGVGMDAETQAKIFDPFFTTKEVGRGTGLGLSTVYGIMDQHGGYITVESKPGEGATFSLFFPRTDKPLHRDLISESDVKSAPSGGETILLVEDEPMVREIARRMLQSEGFDVLEFSDARQACEWAATHDQRIDLLLSDVVMPTMNGSEVVDRIRQNRPGIEVLFMSGFPRDVIAARGGVSNGTHFIQKPFSSKQLSEKVRQVLSYSAEVDV